MAHPPQLLVSFPCTKLSFAHSWHTSPSFVLERSWVPWFWPSVLWRPTVRLYVSVHQFMLGRVWSLWYRAFQWNSTDTHHCAHCKPGPGQEYLYHCICWLLTQCYLEASCRDVKYLFVSSWGIFGGHGIWYNTLWNWSCKTPKETMMIDWPFRRTHVQRRRNGPCLVLGWAWKHTAWVGR